METTYAQKRIFWLDCLQGDDVHSVRNQIIDMTWDLSVYHIINESRGLCPKDDRGQIKTSAMIADFIDRNFAASYLARARRLVDASKIDGDRGVYSIVSILEDMKKHRKKMTRENILKSEEFEYDIENLKREYELASSAKIRSGINVYSFPKRLNVDVLIRRHQDIDLLTGHQQRERGDTVREDIINHIIEHAKSCSEKIKLYVDKYIAHASTPKSREKCNINTLILDDLYIFRDSMQKICDFISGTILGEGFSETMSTPTFDHLKYFDFPLAEGLEKIRELWSEHTLKLNAVRWSDEDWTTVLGIQPNPTQI